MGHRHRLAKTGESWAIEVAPSRPGPSSTTLYGIPNCDTMKKARVWLAQRGVPYVFHDYKKQGVSRDAFERWCEAVGWDKVLNKAGMTFRKLPDEAKADLTQEKAIALMLDQPSMIKRSVLEHDGGPGSLPPGLVIRRPQPVGVRPGIC